MTLQNEHILLEDAHRRVAEMLRAAELDRLARRRPRPRPGVALVLALGLVLAAVGLWGFWAF